MRVKVRVQLKCPMPLVQACLLRRVRSDSPYVALHCSHLSRDTCSLWQYAEPSSWCRGTQTQPKPGTIIVFSISTAVSQPWGIVMATDGNLWFTELQSDKIGRITPGGRSSIPLPSAGSPSDITAGSNGISGSLRDTTNRSDRSRSVVDN